MLLPLPPAIPDHHRCRRTHITVRVCGGAVFATLLLVLTGGCVRGGASAANSRDGASNVSPTTSAANAPHDQVIEGAASVRFVDRAREAGITYRWQIAGKRPLNIRQTIGNGCAFLDYNNDGNLDVLLVGQPPALYRGDGKGRFTDVTAATGINAVSGDLRGCAVGDYDNDGFPDVYLSAYRGGALLRNRQGKRFEDVTRWAGLAPQPWGSSCAFGDVDDDGRLDLYVGNYVKFGPNSTQLCNVNGHWTACAPQNYDAEKGVLYRNRGDGTFQDATRAWGADSVTGKALGIAFADYNGSGRLSLAIANDEVAGDLLRNRGNKFENIGPASGTAYASTGKPHAGMGIDWGDYDNDGRIDLAVATFAGENKAVFQNEGDDLFTDRSGPLGVADAAYPYVTFGLKWLDADNDGWLDLLIANGHTMDNITDYEKGRVYRQPTQFFRNEEQGQRLADRSSQTGPDLQKPIVGRGLAVGDYDNDGRVDAIIVDSEGAALLLHNETVPAGHYLSLTLTGAPSNRDALGATALVETTGGDPKQTRLCRTDGSYLSASDRRVHVGLGAATSATVTIKWPSGRTDVYKNVPADRQVRLREGAPAPL
jgi:hypothetical protein